jgi:hypothetical protein
MKRIKNKIGGQVHLFTVDNNRSGKTAISNLRKQLKNTQHRLILYGRGHRFGKGRIHMKNGDVTGWDNSYQSGLPLTIAQRIAVYITSR